MMRHREESRVSLLIAVLLILFLMLMASCAMAEDIDLDLWASAIYHAEGGEEAVVPYGMFFDGCDWDNVDYCRKIVKNTVFNTLVRYRATRCKDGESDISCMQRRYCPLSDPRDTQGLNKNWQRNVLFYLNNPKETK